MTSRDGRTAGTGRAYDVLAVEDDPIFRESLSLWLDDWGYAARTASTVPAALHVLRDGAPRIAIVDLVLPGRRGLDLIRELRADHGARLPVVLITAHGGLPDARAALQEGAEDVLAKPLRPKRLRAVVETVLAGGRRCLAPPVPPRAPEGRDAVPYSPPTGTPSHVTAHVTADLPLGHLARRAEKLLVYEALEESDGDEAEAARRLGFPEKVFRAKLRRYGETHWGVARG